MASLVLSVVGGILGGPLGAAIGGIAGQAIDRSVIFKPKGREGPRLTDLAVQTSTYGAPIPRVYGTMRVAGSVIWSTDLIESLGKSSSGKGQPTVSTYSYSASFAVLLSGRAAARVGRIWADGKLLRGAAGDFKSQTGYRFYTGDEEQAADPLIASAEGASATPAARGMAYAVFEQFQLADYGNRIPSLTFELVADEAPVRAGTIAVDIGGGSVAAGDEGPLVAGFSAYGDSAASVLGLIAQISGGWFAPSGAAVALQTSTTVPVRVVADDGAAMQGSHGVKRQRRIAPADSVARVVTIAHYDAARDYQTGLQRAARPGAGARVERIDLPAVIDAGGAKLLAEATLSRIEAARERRTIGLGWAAADIAPGAVVALAGEQGTWRVADWSLEGMALSLDLIRLPDTGAPTTTVVASAGRVLANADLLHGPTVPIMAELPPLDDRVLTTPRLLIAAAGREPGWRQAALLLSADDSATFTGLGGTAAPAVIGNMTQVPGVAPSTLIDRRHVVEVELLHAGMSLSGATAAMLDHGANMALIGNELVQFESAEALTPTRWRLRGLWRGRRGTETGITGHVVGERFVLLAPDALVSAGVGLSSIGRDAVLLASGVGDSPNPAQTTAPITGRSIGPPAPVHLKFTATSTGGILRWARRSRQGWSWIDGTDAPLGEERERYRLTIEPPGAPLTTAEASLSEYVLTAAQAVAGTRISVRQAGSAGESPAATILL